MKVAALTLANCTQLTEAAAMSTAMSMSGSQLNLSIVPQPGVARRTMSCSSSSPYDTSPLRQLYRDDKAAFNQEGYQPYVSIPLSECLIADPRPV